MRSVAPITKIVPLFLWSAKMPKIYAKCQKFMQKLWNFIFCHLNIVRAVYKLSFKLLVRSVAHITKIVPPFLWFRGGLCYKQRRIRHGDHWVGAWLYEWKPGAEGMSILAKGFILLNRQYRDVELKTAFCWWYAQLRNSN